MICFADGAESSLDFVAPTIHVPEGFPIPEKSGWIGDARRLVLLSLRPTGPVMTASACIKQHPDLKPASHQLQAVSLLLLLFSLKNFEVFASQRKENSSEETYKQAWARLHTTELM